MTFHKDRQLEFINSGFRKVSFLISFIALWSIGCGTEAPQADSKTVVPVGSCTITLTSHRDYPVDFSYANLQFVVDADGDAATEESFSAQAITGEQMEIEIDALQLSAGSTGHIANSSGDYLATVTAIDENQTDIIHCGGSYEVNFPYEPCLVSAEINFPAGVNGDGEDVNLVISWGLASVLATVPAEQNGAAFVSVYDINPLLDDGYSLTVYGESTLADDTYYYGYVSSNPSFVPYDIYTPECGDELNISLVNGAEVEDDYEPNDQLANAASINLNTDYTANYLDLSDNDFYQLDGLVAGKRYRIFRDYDPDFLTANFSVTVYNSDAPAGGNNNIVVDYQVEPSGGLGSITEAYFSALYSGNYQIQIGADWMGPYSFRIEEVGGFSTIITLPINNSTIAISDGTELYTHKFTEHYGFTGMDYNEANGKIYAGRLVDGHVAVFADVRTGPVGSVDIGATSVSAVAVNSTSYKVYAASYYADTIEVINSISDAYIGQVSVGDQPDDISIDENLNKVFVVNEGDESVSIIDGSSDTVSATISVAGAFSVGANPATGLVYVGKAASNVISVIDGNTEVLTATTIDIGQRAYDFTIDPVNNHIYVAAETMVIVIDGATNTVIKAFSPPTFSINGLRAVRYFSSLHGVYFLYDDGIGRIDVATEQSVFRDASQMQQGARGWLAIQIDD